ncbi:MAG: sugar phosphate isomerase/epimerase [Silicimonas sp.]|nr:sugar phosphate isomerase/epimerase [Silicimonas sp.]
MTKYCYQLYSSRNFGPLPKSLGLLADLGYDSVEGYDALYATPAMATRLRTDLDQAGLQMKSGHFGLDMVESDPETVGKTARILGMDHVIVPYLPEDRRPNDNAGWQALGARLAKVGKPLIANGYSFGWHNHDFEFQPLADGNFPIETILNSAPDLVFEFDVAWATRAGQDPAAWIDRLGHRITAAHVKDIAPDGTAVDEDGWADVGHGVLDWTGLIAALRAKGCERFVVEHDNPGDDARFARQSIEFLARI